jgi:hypothetical protein
MRTYLVCFLTALTLVACGGGNQSSSTGAGVTAQATTDTVLACNSSSSFGGAGPLLTETSNPTLEACNAAIAFTCNASVTYGGTEPALTAITSPSIKTCLAVLDKSNPNNPNNAKVLAGQATLWTPQDDGGCYQSSGYFQGLSNAKRYACEQVANEGDQAACRSIGGLVGSRSYLETLGKNWSCYWPDTYVNRNQ